jgi:CMP/dCMP kinase
MGTKPLIITIDGPAASGKTSVSRELARQLGWSWVSTGAFYRGLAYVAQLAGVSLDDENALSELCHSNIWEVRLQPENTLVFYKGQDISARIYDEDNGAAASKVSQFPKVRQNLLEVQRRCAQNVPGLVAEGRDCGTVVFPEAPVKIYLDADSESRAHRRASEQNKAIEETKKAQSLRDLQDKSRQVAPMQAAKDAHVIDSSSMDLRQVVATIDEIARKELEL